MQLNWAKLSCLVELNWVSKHALTENSTQFQSIEKSSCDELHRGRPELGFTRQMALNFLS